MRKTLSIALLLGLSAAPTLAQTPWAAQSQYSGQITFAEGPVSSSSCGRFQIAHGGGQVFSMAANGTEFAVNWATLVQNAASGYPITFNAAPGAGCSGLFVINPDMGTFDINQ